MYAFFKGKIDKIYNNRIILDVNDIGYEIYIPESDIYTLNIGEMVKIPYYELLNNLDVHPKYANRVSKIEQDLKKELAKGNMNPKLKKELQDTLKEIKNLKQDFKKTAKIKDSDPNAYKKIWMAAFMDEEDFLNKSEEKMTSMKDRDKFYEKMYTEHAELFEIPEGGYDPYEFM